MSIRTMTGLQCILYVSALLVTSYAAELCIFTDTECTTSIARDVFKKVVPGIEGFFGSSDPLYLKEIKEYLPSSRYKISNLTLTGMNQCQVTLLRLNQDETTYQYNLQCPQLVLNFHHEGKGSLGSIELDSNGVGTFTFDDYIFKVNGSYDKFNKENDQNLYFRLYGFTLETEPKGNITYNTDREMLLTNETKAHLAKAYFMEHTKNFERYLKSPIMDKLIIKLDIYLRNFGINVQYPTHS